MRRLVPAIVALVVAAAPAWAVSGRDAQTLIASHGGVCTAVTGVNTMPNGEAFAHCAGGQIYHIYQDKRGTYRVDKGAANAERQARSVLLSHGQGANNGRIVDQNRSCCDALSR